MSGLARRRVPELMDAPGVDPAELTRSLADLRGVNRWLGGTRVALGALTPLLEGHHGREATVLDVGTGSADIPRALVTWARGAGVRLRVVATDFHPATVEAARALSGGFPEVEVRQADGLALPFEAGAFDFAMCHTALHHFDEAEAVRVLRELARVSRRCVVVTDLSRSRPALLGAELLAATVWRRHPVTRHDGPHSVRAAFTPRELSTLARQAGLQRVRVRRHPVFRLSLVAEGTGASA